MLLFLAYKGNRIEIKKTLKLANKKLTKPTISKVNFKSNMLMKRYLPQYQGG